MLQRLDQPTARQRQRRAQQAARKARYRQRLKAGGAVLNVPVRNLNVLIAALLSVHWLPESKSEDRKQIAVAVGALLDDLAANLSRVDSQTIGPVPPSRS